MRRLLFSTLLSIAILLNVAVLAQPAMVAAQTPQAAVCEGIGLTGSTGCTGDQGHSLNSTLKAVLNILSIVAGIAAVIMVIIGGLKYILSNGDSSNVQSAKNTILYAIVGLVIVAFAQSIVHFVLVKV